MLVSASAEFVALCQSQVRLVGTLLGARTTAVYLAENWHSQSLPELVPVAVYPHGNPEPGPWGRAPNLTLGPGTEGATVLKDGVGEESRAGWSDGPQFPPGSAPSPGDLQSPQAFSFDTLTWPSQGPTWGATPVAGVDPDRNPEGDPDLPPGMGPGMGPDFSQGGGDRLVVPLVHEQLVMGVLVSWRGERPWALQERHQLEALAQTLALACVLDQRGQWLQGQLQTQQQTQLQQSQRFHELLHQVRNPLTALRVFGKLLIKRIPRGDRNHDLAVGVVQESDRVADLLGYFDHALEQGDHQLTVNSRPLLPGAAPEAVGNEGTGVGNPGAIAGLGGPLQPQSWGVTTQLPPLLGSAQTWAEEQGFQFQTLIAPQAAPLWVDATALREVVQSLLENAFKYANPGASIWVMAGVKVPPPQGDGAYEALIVGDTGPGIPLEDQPRIFERAYRGVQAAGAIAGTGLGLAIVADLVAGMGGQVAVYSPLGRWPGPLPPGVPPERGCLFAVWLPVAIPD